MIGQYNFLLLGNGASGICEEVCHNERRFRLDAPAPVRSRGFLPFFVFLYIFPVNLRRL